MATFALKDDSVVVIIGSGAGGGTLAHELTRRGIKVVLLEAGSRQSLDSFSQVPGEAFNQLTWLDTRTQSGDWGVARDFPKPAGVALQDRWRHDRTLDGVLSPASTLGIAGAHNLRRGRRNFLNRLADHARRTRKVLRDRREPHGRHAAQRHTGFARLEQL